VYRLPSCKAKTPEYTALVYLPDTNTNTAEERGRCADILMENFYTNCISKCKIIESTNCRVLISKQEIEERDLQDNGYAGIEYTLKDIDYFIQDIDNDRQNNLHINKKIKTENQNIFFVCVGMRFYGSRKIKTNDRLSFKREPNNSADNNAIKILINGEKLGYVKREHTPKFNGIDLGDKIPKIVNQENPSAYFMKVTI